MLLRPTSSVTVVDRSVIAYRSERTFFPLLQVQDPTTEDLGAGAGANFDGAAQAQRTFKETAGVVEGRPGVIESSNIDPLNQNSNKGSCGFAARCSSHC